MRLFVGIAPSEPMRAALSGLQERLLDAGIGGRFLEASNLRLTLAFIGEGTQDITNLLPHVRQPFQISLSHIGLFQQAKVLWAGVRPSKALEDAAYLVRKALEDNGIPFDCKPFHPHITLVRKPLIPEGFSPDRIEIPQADMTVRKISLYKSERGENGMVYSVIGGSF